ncbi:MAG: type II secretion system protein [Planctomycetes bacterium]|nr:type II secretion system protein [Planctomycetota bacterium]
MSSRHTRSRRGFTLIEVLIVVVILGILAATVLPQFTSASDDARESALRQDLQTLRSQIELFKFQHNGKYPAFGSTNPQDFKDAMLLSSDPDGTTGAVGTKPLGPYFIGQLPANPYTGGREVRIVSDVPGATPDDDPTDGWFYNPATGQVKVNASGTAKDGTPLADL